MVLDGLRNGQVPFQSENLHDIVHFFMLSCLSSVTD